MADRQEYMAKAALPLGRRVRVWAILLAFCGAILAMTIYGVVIGYRGMQPGVAIDKRLEMLLGATGLLFPAWIVAKGYLLRRWQTGRWKRTREEAVQQLQQCRVRNANRMQTRPASWVTFLYRWGNYNAFDVTATAWKRAAGWAVLTGFALGLLAVIAFGFICFGAAFADDNTFSGAAGFLVIGMVVLVFPTGVVWKQIQRRQENGTFRISHEELQDVVERREAWQESERAKPLGAKIGSLFVLACVLTWYWLRSVVYHTGHKEADWITPIAYTIFGGYAVWVQFCKPKRDSSTQ